MLGNILIFLAAVVFARGVGMFQSFALATALDPEQFGVWVTLMVIVSFCPILALGTLEAMVKEIPYHIGRGDAQKVRDVENSALASVIIVAGVCLALAVLSWLVFPVGVANIPPTCLSLVFLTVGISTFSSFYYWRFTAYEDFRNTARMDLIRAACAFGFIVGLAFAWGLTGAVLGFVLHEAAVCLVTFRRNIRTHGKVRANFSFRLLIHAVRVGLPITLLWWVLAVQAGIDRIVIGEMLDSSAVGYYGLGISITGAIALVPMVVGRVLYPMVNREFGRASDSSAMGQLVLAPTYSLGFLLANVQLLLTAITPLLYLKLFPKYSPGLAAGQIFILGCFFVCLLRNGANFLIATHKEKVFLGYTLIALGLNLVTACAFVRVGFGLAGVAWATSLAGAVLSFMVWRRVLIGLGFAGSSLWGELCRLHLPIFILGGGVGVLHAASPLTGRVVNPTLAVSIWLLFWVLLNAALYAVPPFRAEFDRCYRRFKELLRLRTRNRGIRHQAGLFHIK